MNQKINVIDLFAGCGGITEGFKSTGYYNTVACVERDVKCCDTLKKRLSEKRGYKDSNERVICHDIQDTETIINGDGKNIKGINKLTENQKTDIIVGGPPCQAYSIAGRIRDKDGMQNDYRNYLFESYIKIVKSYSPKFFIFENVPGILSAQPNGVNIIEEIKKGFNSIGYIIPDDLKKHGLLDVSDFGVPQKRKRVIILGVRKDLYYKDIFADFFLLFLKSQSIMKKITVREAIGDLPKLFPTSSSDGKKSHIAGEHNSSLESHFSRFHSERDIKIFRELANDKMFGNGKYKTTEDLKKLYEKETGKKSNVHKYNVIDRNSQSNTIVAHLYKDGLRHIHPDPEQARSITIREAARLQSFPDDFIFKGSMGDQYKMIGNAVPPIFAKCLGIACHNLYIKLTKNDSRKVIRS